jgi:hypothetical protein
LGIFWELPKSFENLMATLWTYWEQGEKTKNPSHLAHSKRKNLDHS